MGASVADGILRGLEQARAFANGTAKKGTYVVHIPPEIDVKAIRGRLGMTQREFAVAFRFSVNNGAPLGTGKTGPRRSNTSIPAGDRS